MRKSAVILIVTDHILDKLKIVATDSGNLKLFGNFPCICGKKIKMIHSPIVSKTISFLLFLFIHAASFANVWYVAPGGNDTNPGTIAQPFQTIQKAQTVVSPGDTFYIRGGTYLMQESQINSYSRIQAFVTLLDKSG